MPAPDPGAGPATLIVALPVDGTVFAPPRFVMADAAGTATVLDATGHSITGFPLTGKEQHISITKASSLSGSSKLWGFY